MNDNTTRWISIAMVTLMVLSSVGGVVAAF